MHKKRENTGDMRKIEIKDCVKDLQPLGRTFFMNNMLYCNWTCSGVRFVFEGSSLSVKMKAIPGTEQEYDAATGMLSQREVNPWMAVFLDDKDDFYEYFELRKEEHLYSVFQSERPEKHTITIRKITENMKGKAALMEFVADGEISRGEKQRRSLKIEVIGDSITCGFGNMVNDGEREFYSCDENGWMSYAAVAARELCADFSCISCSGIAVTEGIGRFEYGIKPMKYYYPYRDRMIEELERPETEPEKWNFEENRPDIIVVNLGTNDATVIDLNEDIKAGIEKFEKDYYDFLKLLRRCNGKEPRIICSLGSLDYFLYDSICKTADKFIRDTGDENISCFKFGRVRINDGLGACRHPYVTTHVRMGRELARYIMERQSYLKG